jgi:hypothetical protein
MHSCQASESSKIVTSAECMESRMSLSERALFDFDGLTGPGPPQSCSTGVEGAGRRWRGRGARRGGKGESSSGRCC